MQCEASLEKLERMSLPSLGRFDAKAAQCMGAFDSGCTGPARHHQWERLQHAHARERARFQQEYNNRLYNGLTIAALGTALLCRFVFKQMIPEMAGWLAFVFLEVCLISDTAIPLLRQGYSHVCGPVGGVANASAGQECTNFAWLNAATLTVFKFV